MFRSGETTIDLDLVARFVHVAEARSFAGAAAKTGLPKSTLSRSVTRLEAALGVRLLERTTRSLRLTDEGLHLFETASRGLATIDEALDLASDSPTRLRGTLRVSAPPDLAQLVLSEMITRFVAEHPDVRIDIELTGRYVDLVKEGFDLAFRAGTLRDSSLVARKLCDLPGAIYASPSYLETHGPPRKPADLERHVFVLFRPTNGEQRLVLRSAKGTSKLVVRGCIGSDDLAFLRESCVAGGGITWLPRLVGDRDVEAGRLVRVLPAYETPASGLHLVYPSSRLSPARLIAFRDFALAFFRNR